MSGSGNQTPKRSDMQHELKELLHSMEKAHKADIQTYSSGHLGPNSLMHKPLDCIPRKPIWGKPKSKEDMAPDHIREKSKMEKAADALRGFTLAAVLQEPRTKERPENPSEDLLPADLGRSRVLDTPELDKVRRAKQERCTGSDVVEQGSCWFEDGVPWSERLRRRRRFDTQVLRTKDLTNRECLRGREAAKQHERRLQQALRKLPAGGGPCSERLAVFSDVFDDVCDGSPAFGSILRVIKTEYDLYVKSLLSSQSPLQDKFACISFGDETELKEAARRVLLLEQEARRALEENDRVKAEYEDARAKALVDQKENGHRGLESCDETVKGCELSSMAQVWKVWDEVQRLQKDIRDTMVSTVTTSALENCIRDSEDEIMSFTASNVLLQRTNEDLERDISTLLSNVKVSKETKTQVWEEIWTTLNT